MRRITVRIKVALGIDDRIGIGAAIQNIQRRDSHGPFDAAAFAAGRILSGIPRTGCSHALAHAARQEVDVREVTLLHKGHIRVVIAAAQHVRCKTCTLHRHLGGIHEHGGSPGGCRDIGIARGVDHGLGQDHAALTIRQHNDHALHRLIDHDRARHERAIVDTRAGIFRGAPIPLALGLRQHGARGFDPGINRIGRETAEVAIIIHADASIGLNAAHAVEKFNDHGIGALLRRGNRGRCTGRTCADNEHIALVEHRQHARAIRHCGATGKHIRRRQNAVQLIHRVGLRRRAVARDSERAKRARGSLRSCRSAQFAGHRLHACRIAQGCSHVARNAGADAEHVPALQGQRTIRLHIHERFALPLGSRILHGAADHTIRRHPEQTVRLIETGRHPGLVAQKLLHGKQFAFTPRGQRRCERAAEELARDDRLLTSRRAHTRNRGPKEFTADGFDRKPGGGRRLHLIRNHHARKGVITRRKGLFGCSGGCGQPGRLRGIDDGLGADGGTPVAAGKDNAADFACAIA